ncbi:hypothetical protein EAO22_29320 [Klebsiella pneumoniae]|nr:hypothetical protein EAO22_29320 [Klebsiella pneumoniae]
MMVLLGSGGCFEQEGQHAARCSRHFYASRSQRCKKQGIETLAAGELEFICYQSRTYRGIADGTLTVGGLLTHESMINDLVRTLEEANVGRNNFMLNMAPVSLSFHWHRPIP